MTETRSAPPPVINGVAHGEPPTVPNEIIRQSDPGGGFLTAPEVYMTGGILVFAMAALAFLYLIARIPNHSAFLLRIYIVTIIVFGTLAIVSSSLASEHIAPVVGLFGTIAGYIMGRSETATASEIDRRSNPAGGPAPPAGPKMTAG